MEIILLLIYSFFVWLIFFKFKWLPWTFVSQVIVVVDVRLRTARAVAEVVGREVVDDPDEPGPQGAAF